jgi:hypothetical protein
MRNLIAILFSFFFIIAFGQNKKVKLTAIVFDNQNPNFEVKVDTIMKAEEINLNELNIDVFFTNKKFHYPYYVPTDGIYKNLSKEKECDMTIYPHNVKCYEYDDRNRVLKMNISGSGTINNFTYSYNEKNQIVAITDITKKYYLKYNSDGTLKEIYNDGVLKKRILFIYQ